MSVLNPTQLETTDYGQAGWNAVHSANMQKLNDYLAKHQDLWDVDALPDKVLIQFDDSQGKWVAKTLEQVLPSATETQILVKGSSVWEAKDFDVRGRPGHGRHRGQQARRWDEG